MTQFGTVKALGEYKFPSRSRQELYGDDQLVHVWWKNNPMFCSAASFRAPRAMTFDDFREQLVYPWAASDPDFDPATEFTWELDGQPFTPAGDTSLIDQGIDHKHTLTMTGGECIRIG